jgi:hypothetical protein
MIPVLVIGFNRPEMLRQVLERVRVMEPESVYVAIDGPRPARDDDREAVKACQAAVESLNWSCPVRTLFRDSNLGCGRAVSGAIDWFFDHEEFGVILEDDVLPDPTFFPFADETLRRYRDNSGIFAISGCNFVPGDVLMQQSSYRYSRIPHVWGWGTWRRAWRSYRFDLREPDARVGFREIRTGCGGSPSAMVHWQAIYSMVARGHIDTWDYQFAFACMKAGARVVTSNVNLVENIGFGASATHTFDRPSYLLPVSAMTFPLREPTIPVDVAADAWIQRHVFDASWSGLARLGYRALRQSLS